MFDQDPLDSAYVQIRLRWGLIYAVTLIALLAVDEYLFEPGDPLRPVYATVFAVTVTSIFSSLEWYFHQRSNKN